MPIKDRSQLRKTLIRTILVFLVSYSLFLAVWLKGQSHYDMGITLLASKMAAGFTGLKLEDITDTGTGLDATFSSINRKSNIVMVVPIQSFAYTYDIPLVLSFLAALYPFIRSRGRAYAEAALIIVATHIFCIFVLEVKLLTDGLAAKGIGTTGPAVAGVLEYLYSFTYSVIRRSESFIIGLYIYIRFKRQETKD